MAENLGTGVSYVDDENGYNEDLVVFQKGKPPLDTELNLVQQIQNAINQRQMSNLPSGWLSLRKFYTNRNLSNKFYTQDPSTAIPEFAVVNGMVVYVTNTGTTEPNSNLIDLGTPPTTGNRLNGIFLEVWRALLDPSSNANKPDPATIIDSLLDVDMIDENFGNAVGENGLILRTENAGQTWNVQSIDTKGKLNSVYFYNQSLGWVAGDGGTIARTSSGGTRWTILSSGTTENLNGIYMATQLIGWAVGTSGTILRTSNGINWTPQISGVTANLKSIYFYDNLVGWAVGEKGTILKTTNGGTSWSIMGSPTTNTLNAVTFYDLNTGYTVGINGTLLRSSDGGLTWISQSGNIYDGVNYSTITTDLNDVSMVPSLDVYENGEEVTSQFTGSNKNFIVLHSPITKGDGKGTTSTNPADVKVTVNGNQVAVDSINGSTGQVILASAPAYGAVVKVFYYHKCSVAGGFNGRVFACGKAGIVIRTDNIGAQWTVQNPQTAYDLNGIYFVTKDIGWTVGTFSIIRYTNNGGTQWNIQQSSVVVRQVQRIFYEGNVGTVVYLNDDSIHPDANIVTTKRVQVQYRIRIIDGVDPVNFPEAGLGSASITGFGPNISGQFPFENMGATTGDYGLWRAKCENTVDGYCWAIPMFFVNRRNSSAFDSASNNNGSNQKNTAFIRPDLLVATNVIDSDILDVRRVSIAPPVTELLEKNFDLVMSNRLDTRFFRNAVGGDRYGTELLQIDRVGGGTGGELISGTLSDAVNGLISSESSLLVAPPPPPLPATSIPLPTSLTISGIFSSNPVNYSVTYASTDPINDPSIYEGKPVPGYFTGLGTDTVVFTFGSDTLTNLDDPKLGSYSIIAKYISLSSTSLKYVPVDPKLIKNTSGSGSLPFYYQGVLSIEDSRIIEQWDSGIPGKTNYAVVYSKKDQTDVDQRNRASSVEVHFFVTVTDNSTNILTISKDLYPDISDVQYSLYTISNIRNVDSGFTYKIKNITVSNSLPTIIITSESGFPFLKGAILEITASVETSIGNGNVRNGASANFTPRIKKIGSFCSSIIASITIPPTPQISISINVPNSIILGTSVTETTNSLTQPICWIFDGVSYNMTPVSITWFTPDTIVLNFSTVHSGTVYIQLNVQQLELTYSGLQDGLLIAYNYAPYQGDVNLPTSLTVELVTKPSMVCISNLSTGGGVEGVPYSIPLTNIPFNNSTISDENYFSNLDKLRFNNFSVDTGFVQMPVYVPADTGSDIILTTPVSDILQRFYYSSCSRELVFSTEGLTIGEARKIFVGAIAKIKSSSDLKFLTGEYVLIIFSREALTDTQNFTGYKTNSNCVIAVYRLPNKPMVRE